MPEPKPTTADILTAAYGIMAFPHTWTRGAPARDAAGKAVDPTSTSVTRWCALGAIDLATHRLIPHPSKIANRHQAQTEARKACNRTVRDLTEQRYKNIAAYNDGTNHSCIMHTLQIAISDLVPAAHEPTR